MSRVRILVVDDFELWRRSICSILEKDPDLEVVGEASDGLEAIQMNEVLRPDLILLDIEMPKVDGLDAARRILMVSPGTKILFISSYILQEALSLGVGFVFKPDVARDLLPMVRAVTENEPFVRLGLLDDDPPNPEQT